MVRGNGNQQITAKVIQFEDKERGKMEGTQDGVQQKQVEEQEETVNQRAKSPEPEQVPGQGIPVASAPSAGLVKRDSDPPENGPSLAVDLHDAAKRLVKVLENDPRHGELEVAYREARAAVAAFEEAAEYIRERMPTTTKVAD